VPLEVRELVAERRCDFYWKATLWLEEETVGSSFNLTPEALTILTIGKCRLQMHVFK